MRQPNVHDKARGQALDRVPGKAVGVEEVLGCLMEITLYRVIQANGKL